MADKYHSDDDLVNHIANLAAHIRSIGEVLPVGNTYLMPGMGGGPSDTGVTIAVNTLYIMPLWIPRNLTIDRIATHVSTPATASLKARLGIYRVAANLAPAALVLDAGEVAVDSTGVKTIVISQPLTKGIYYTAIVSDGTPGILAYGSGWVPTGIQSSHFGYPVFTQYKSHTYGALPNPFGVVAASFRSLLAVLVRPASMD